jgi:hypothetical protein
MGYTKPKDHMYDQAAASLCKTQHDSDTRSTRVSSHRLSISVINIVNSGLRRQSKNPLRLTALASAALKYLDWMILQ